MNSNPPDERTEIAKRIRGLRRSLGIPIQRLAAGAGISPGYLSEVERGLSAISGEKLARIASEMGVTADYLLTGRSESSDSTIQIPAGLSEAAKALDLTYAKTVRLLAGKESLVAHRAKEPETEWRKEDWIEFYKKVKPYL
jgi:transcriptional regulator with XRE-family HTH domain